jgi:hypothetical protein
MGTVDWIGHGMLFFLAGFTYWLMRAGRHNFGSILTIALPVAGIYFLGWWALLTFIVGVLMAAQTFSKAVQVGKDPFSNPWRQPPDAN